MSTNRVTKDVHSIQPLPPFPEDWDKLEDEFRREGSFYAYLVKMGWLELTRRFGDEAVIDAAYTGLDVCTRTRERWVARFLATSDQK